VVSLLSAGHSKRAGSETDARRSSIVLRSAAACSFEIRRVTGISELNAGSPRSRARSANARRIVSVMRWTLAADPKPSFARS
jgi:hypothetical protein